MDWTGGHRRVDGPILPLATSGDPASYILVRPRASRFCRVMRSRVNLAELRQLVKPTQCAASRGHPRSSTCRAERVAWRAGRTGIACTVPGLPGSWIRAAVAALRRSIPNHPSHAKDGSPSLTSPAHETLSITIASQRVRRLRCWRSRTGTRGLRPHLATPRHNGFSAPPPHVAPPTSPRRTPAIRSRGVPCRQLNARCRISGCPNPPGSPATPTTVRVSPPGKEISGICWRICFEPATVKTIL